MAEISLSYINVAFGDHIALHDISFHIPQGQFVSIVGPTGCGKSSILNVLAGLLKPAAGSVFTGGRELRSINKEAAYMFQQDALLPWKNCRENVMLGPIFRGKARGEAAADALRWLERVGLAGFEKRYPSELSGGQRKRVAMAQALINRLPILLMDESFSALDVQTRSLMENELLGMWAERRASVLFVTHDLEEAIALADRVVVLAAGPRSYPVCELMIDLPRPRDVAEIRLDPHFVALHAQIWHTLKEQVMVAHARAEG